MTGAFLQHMAALTEAARLQGSAFALPGVVKRPWQIPANYPPGVDVQNPAAFITACDRSDLNYLCINEYETGAEANAGRRGVVMAAKTAIDYQAAYERALHARHASALRCRVWAGGRRAGQGDTTYGVFGCVMRYLDSTVSAARSVANTPASDVF